MKLFRRIKKTADVYTAKESPRMIGSVSVTIDSDDKRAYTKLFEIIPEAASYKKETIYHVKARAQTIGLASIGQYLSYLKTHPEEEAYLRENLTYLGSHFFRGNDWDYFGEHCLARFAGAEKVRLWCAACSSGKEVYSVLMMLMDYVPLERIEILASDYNEEMLKKCRTAHYFNMHRPTIPEKYRHYVVDVENGFSFRQDLIDAVQTQKINLLTDEFPTGFDIILCRNVLKFFDRAASAAVHKKLAASLNQGGCLFLSADDDHKFVEFIKDPSALGLTQLEDRCMYIKE